MSRVVVTRFAARGMERCRKFLARKSPDAAKRAGRSIDDHLKQLMAFPSIGRPFSDLPGCRELVIPFGDSGYLALYHHEPDNDVVYVLAFRHQREAGY